MSNPFSDQDNPYAGPKAGGPGGPPGGGGPIPKGTVKNYLVEAILCLVCCGGVFAIPALIYAVQVDSKLSAGDYNGAVEASDNAKKWCIIAVCIAVACGGIGFLAQIFLAAAANA